ncbi:hypothetical protein WN51_12666 [Melipona quadrifasciata]|uniref:Uncharacterized protein n=1 Tax=Melipona quadrifasciata TaxID=166423 RepID=A0A0N0U5Q7_9HYME|nr:hypothetical protein WN51_12666 [Melipona quadrifasciata]
MHVSIPRHKGSTVNDDNIYYVLVHCTFGELKIEHAGLRYKIERHIAMQKR